MKKNPLRQAAASGPKSNPLRSAAGATASSNQLRAAAASTHLQTTTPVVAAYQPKVRSKDEYDFAEVPALKAFVTKFSAVLEGTVPAAEVNPLVANINAAVAGLVDPTTIKTKAADDALDLAIVNLDKSLKALTGYLKDLLSEGLMAKMQAPAVYQGGNDVTPEEFMALDVEDLIELQPAFALTAQAFEIMEESDKFKAEHIIALVQPQLVLNEEVLAGLMSSSKLTAEDVITMIKPEVTELLAVRDARIAAEKAAAELAAKEAAELAAAELAAKEAAEKEAAELAAKVAEELAAKEAAELAAKEAAELAAEEEVAQTTPAKQQVAEESEAPAVQQDETPKPLLGAGAFSATKAAANAAKKAAALKAAQDLAAQEAANANVAETAATPSGPGM